MDKKLVVSTMVLIGLLSISYPVFGSMSVAANVKATDNRPTVIVEYGRGAEVGLMKVTQIHYAQPPAHSRPAKSASCFKVSGWRWGSPIRYTIDPASPVALEMVRAAIKNSSSEWDSSSSRELFAEPATSPAPWNTYDGTNSVSFGDYATPDVIAVTAIWYNRATKNAVESDILFDTNFTWGDACQDPYVMDIQNIATHEMGHTLGLNDISQGSCSAVTMYAYSMYGETDKRTLETPDITGLQKIYGI